MTDAWAQALRFAALPDAVSVEFERQDVIENGTPTTRYILRSMSAAGQAIGDDRDYDLLKAVMTPLEKLADAHNHNNLKLKYDLESGHLTGLPGAG
ncbi:MAG: hypothetical protein AAF331_04150 [Pseudomonadota bacterium]